MTITSTTLQWNGASGTWSLGSGHQYTAHWRVITDDPYEQAATIINYFAAAVVPLGAFYQYASDPTDLKAIAKDIRATRDLGSTTVWNVIVEYGPEDEDEGEDEDGNPTEDPLKFRPDISWQTVQYTRPVERSTYLFGFRGKTAERVPEGSFVIPMNSSMIPFNPGLEMDDARGVLRVQRNLATIAADEITDLMNVVNQSPFQINKWGFSKSFLSRTAKVRDVSIAFRTLNGIDYWDVAVFADYRSGTWVEGVIDRGVNGRALAGDMTGHGGTISGSGQGGPGDVPPGTPKTRRFTDLYEEPLPDPVLLDGDGHALDLELSPLSPVVLDYLHYTEWDFTTISFFDPVISPLA